MNDVTTEAARRLLIGGELRDGNGELEVTNPASGEVVTRVPAASAAQLDEAVAAAVAAAPEWGARANRGETIAKIAAAIADNAHALGRALSLETGIPFALAKAEAEQAAGFVLYRAQADLSPEVIKEDERQRIELLRTPIGVVGAILPWNAPLMLGGEKLGTALAAGDTVVFKASPYAPTSPLLLGEIIADIAPPGVVNVLAGGDELGAKLVEHPDVGMISFTGSVSTGQAIMSSAGASLKRLSLELGGNDPAIVMPDADVDRVARQLFARAFFRSGQICAAVKRIYVHEDMVEAFAAALVAEAEQVKLGDPFEEGVTMGPLSNEPQLRRVEELVDRAREDGGDVLTGGEGFGPGYFFRPTVVTGLDAESPLVAEEQFGPAVPLVSYTDLDEAVSLANGTGFGLGASVWGADTEAAEAVSRRLRAGTVWVNRHGVVVPDVPYGGMKQSGFGRSNGDAGLDSYTELQTVSVALPRPTAA